MSTTGGSELEHIKYLGQVSTITRVLTSKDGDLLSYFYNITDDDTNASMKNKSLNDRLVNNHIVEVDRGKIKGQLPLEHFFGFCRTFKKVTKNLGFHLRFKTNDLQNILFTSFGDVLHISVTINSLYLFVSILIPNTQTQVMFNESVRNKHTITYDSWYTERKLSTDGNELRVDIGSAQHINFPKYIVASFQTAGRIAAPNKDNNVAIFDNVYVRKCFCEIDGYSNPKDTVFTDFPENDYVDQYSDLNLFYKEYVGQELKITFISHPNMKNKYQIQVIDLRFQVDHISPQKIRYLKNLKPMLLIWMLDCLLY